MDIRWSQWHPDWGMRGCGVRDYGTIMRWLHEIGKDAKRCLAKVDKPHCVYGATVHEDGKLVEIRLYQDTYMTDDELDAIAQKLPHETIYAVHK